MVQCFPWNQAYKSTVECGTDRGCASVADGQSSRSTERRWFHGKPETSERVQSELLDPLLWMSVSLEPTPPPEGGCVRCAPESSNFWIVESRVGGHPEPEDVRDTAPQEQQEFPVKRLAPSKMPAPPPARTSQRSRA